MTIRAVAFDLWETLITDTPELSKRQERLRLERMEQILGARGFAAEADRIEHAYRRLWHQCQELYWSSDVDIPCRRQIEHFLEALELDAQSFHDEALTELEHAYASAALDILPATVDGARDVLAGLRDRGLRTGLISNTGRTPGYVLRDVLDALGLGAYIDTMVFSNEHGVCKPQTSIFEELRSGLGVAPEELVFVGDNLYVDVYGAQRCGMRGVHFVPAVRGTAIAPAVDHGLTIEPDATIRHLRELGAVLDALDRCETANTSA
jgi:HAD superfamily hydrolase (TIGR01509 family)